jgi:Bacterial protein of unknown function (DUF945)
MNRTVAIVIALAALVAAAATPWVIGWRAEQLIRARVAQVDVDKTAKFQLRIDRYERGWHGANAQFSILSRDGTALLTLPAMIRHWPFTSEGPAAWDATPELAPALHDMLGPWGAKLPDLSTHTRISWSGDVLIELASPEFTRRVPEVAGGTIQIGAISGTVNWRRDGTLTYDMALPVFRIERRALGRAEDMGAVEFKGATARGDGSLGAVERRWNQNGSLAAASVLVTEAGAPIFSATTPVVSFGSKDLGESVAVQSAFAATAVNAKYGLQNLSDAAIEFKVDVRQLAKEPFGRLLDASAKPAGNASGPSPPAMEVFDDLLRGSPAADLLFTLKSREGRVEVKLALAFDGQGYEPKTSATNMLQRLSAELNARASTALVVNGVQGGTSVAAGMLPSPRAPANAGAPPVDAEVAARLKISEAVAQGWVRIEGDELAATIVWRNGRLMVNGQDKTDVRDLIQGNAAPGQEKIEARELAQVNAAPAPQTPCPSTFAGLQQRDVPNIAACTAFHNDVCRQVCGARYDKLEIRDFNQTSGRPGLLCQDTSMEPMKNGVSFISDPARASCLEVHEGMFRWCTNYNKTVGGIDFGAFVQCQGQIKGR